MEFQLQFIQICGIYDIYDSAECKMAFVQLVNLERKRTTKEQREKLFKSWINNKQDLK